jgi:hypothetical protein
MAPGDGFDQFTEVTSTSWLQRLGQALGGMLFAVVALLISVVLLFWNEGRAIHTAQGLSEGAGIVRSVSPTTVDAANNGRLVHVSGELSMAGPVADPEFGLRVSAVRLLRTVEMYQWKEETQTETRTKLGGGEERTTTTRYERGWSDRPIDSNRFREPRGHTNPLMPYQTRDLVAAGVRLGAFAVPEHLLEGFGTPRRISATDTQANALQIRVGKPVRVVDGVLHVGRDPQQPQVGDMRVSFAEVPLQRASVVAMQSGAGFTAFRTRAGTDVELIASGDVPAAAMFQEAEQENTTFTWILRAVGALVMMVGFSMMLRPLAVAGDVVPLVGKVLGAGVAIVSLLCTVAIAPLVIAFAWLWYRPLVALGVLVVGGGATFLLARMAGRRAAAMRPLTPAIRKPSPSP